MLFFPSNFFKFIASIFFITLLSGEALSKPKEGQIICKHLNSKFKIIFYYTLFDKEYAPPKGIDSSKFYTMRKIKTEKCYNQGKNKIFFSNDSYLYTKIICNSKECLDSFYIIGNKWLITSGTKKLNIKYYKTKTKIRLSLTKNQSAWLKIKNSPENRLKKLTVNENNLFSPKHAKKMFFKIIGSNSLKRSMFLRFPPRIPEIDINCPKNQIKKIQEYSTLLHDLLNNRKINDLEQLKEKINLRIQTLIQKTKNSRTEQGKIRNTAKYQKFDIIKLFTNASLKKFKIIRKDIIKKTYKVNEILDSCT